MQSASRKPACNQPPGNQHAISLQEADCNQPPGNQHAISLQETSMQSASRRLIAISLKEIVLGLHGHFHTRCYQVWGCVACGA